MKGVTRGMLLSLMAALSLAFIHNALSAPEGILSVCHDDVQKFCAKVKPGQGRVSRCLMGHESDLSEACKTRLENVLGHMKEAREACSDDAKKFCKDTQGGHGRIIACLKQHSDELSDDCKTEMTR